MEDSLAPLLNRDANVCCEQIQWEALAFDELLPRAADMIVAVPGARDSTAMDRFRSLARQRLAVPILAVLPEHSDEPLLRAVVPTVDDFLLRPVRAPELCHRIARLLGPEPSGSESVQRRLSHELGVAQLIGGDPTFSHTIQQLPVFAASGVPVLITGETGTGKEVFARAIHHLSARHDGPFMTVDCAALPEHLLENELFGHAPGAFTDARQPRKGQVALADGGALFLDEIDALSLTAQGRLLRLVQERTFRPLGAEQVMHANIRILAATNRDLESCVHARQFRADLYYRLNVLRLHLPPLRERPGDIVLLARHFLATASLPSTQRQSFSTGAIRALTLYDWPGNIRELLNVVQRAAVVCTGSQILPSHLALPTASPPAPAAAVPGSRAAVRAAFERRYVEELLQTYHGNVTHAAKAAGMDRRNFGRLLQKHGLSRLRDRDETRRWGEFAPE